MDKSYKVFLHLKKCGVYIMRETSVGKNLVTFSLNTFDVRKKSFRYTSKRQKKNIHKSDVKTVKKDMKTVYFEGKPVEPCFGQSKKLKKCFGRGLKNRRKFF